MGSVKKAALTGDTVDVFNKLHEDHFDNVEEVYIEGEYKKVVCDGYSLEFDDYLKEELGNVISGGIDIFYVDCFKGLSRNFEKVLHVLQIVLQSEKAFVTCNYYISDGRIEKRKRILRASHGQKDMFVNLRNLSGLPPFFKNLLREMARGADF